MYRSAASIYLQKLVNQFLTSFLFPANNKKFSVKNVNSYLSTCKSVSIFTLVVKAFRYRNTIYFNFRNFGQNRGTFVLFVCIT